MKNFSLRELVDRETYETEGDEAWRHFDQHALTALDDLSEFFAVLTGGHVPITCNNWYWGGQFQFRGFRPASYPAKLSPLGSAHRCGKAFDVDVKGFTAAEARQAIIANQESTLLAKIMRMEADVNWLHLDIMETGKPRIYLFKA